MQNVLTMISSAKIAPKKRPAKFKLASLQIIIPKSNPDNYRDRNPKSTILLSRITQIL
jgi:hypothetical protein